MALRSLLFFNTILCKCDKNSKNSANYARTTIRGKIWTERQVGAQAERV
jgi:hypothetical protein